MSRDRRLRQKAESVLDWSPTSGATVRAPNGRHIVRIGAIGMLREWNEIRVRYEHRHLTDGDLQEFGYWLGAADDLGTDYEYTGGAAGVQADGATVEGVSDIRPAPPSEASWFELVFHWYGDRPGINDPPPTRLRVPLPLAEIEDMAQ